MKNLTKTIEQRVLKFISNHSLISKGDTVLVALSGGPDSVFLLHFLKKYQKKFELELSAFHLNHSLRKSADAEQKFCNELCKELSVPIYTFKDDIRAFAKQNKVSIEEAGRNLRYKYLRELADEINFNKIATAHNADDNAETVLLNISKGTGVKGISGIPFQRENIIRPILCLRKSEIISYLKKQKISYVFDESNLSEDYERNFIRLKIIPLLEKKLNPGFVNSVFSTSINLQSFIKYIEKTISKLQKKYAESDSNELRLKLSLFTQEDEFIQQEIIRKILSENFKLQPEQKDVEKIIFLKEKQVGTLELLKNEIKAIRERNYISLYVKQHHSGKFIKIKAGETKQFNSHSLSISKVDVSDVKLTPDKNIEYVDGDLTGENFIIRKWKDGDKFKPIGMSGTKKISDYLNDIKTEAREKKNQFVLLSRNKIVWVIGKRLDERFKIKPNSKIIYKLELINE